MQQDKAGGCALVVFMDRAGFSPPELKAACYRKLVDHQPHLTRKQFEDIVYSLETYLLLSDAEKQVFQRLIVEVYPEVSQMIINPLIEQGIQQGLQQGHEEGAIEAKQETLLEQMQLKFGALPHPIIERVQSIQEIEPLNAFLRRVITTTRLEEMGIENGFGTRAE